MLIFTLILIFYFTVITSYEIDKSNLNMEYLMTRFCKDVNMLSDDENITKAIENISNIYIYV